MGFDFNGRLHEIYCCERGNFGPILAIRTGSADFSHLLVTRLRKYGYLQQDGWLHVAQAGKAVPVPCPAEADYFRAAGYSSVPDPHDREVTHA